MPHIHSHNNKQHPTIHIYNSAPVEERWFLAFEDGSVLESAPHPFEPTGGQMRPEHQVWNKDGDWIGADSEIPCRCVTRTAEAVLGGRACIELFARYERGDYGTGEAGFAVYRIHDATIWIIDDAVRTPDGCEPARDPSLSPGPQTLLLPEDY